MWNKDDVDDPNIIIATDFFFLPPPAALKAASVSELTQISAANETATFMDFLQSVKMTDKHWEH